MRANILGFFACCLAASCLIYLINRDPIAFYLLSFLTPLCIGMLLGILLSDDNKGAEHDRQG